MAFIRRGHVRVPHRQKDKILLHRLDGSPVHLIINDINHWEEHTLTGSIRGIVTVWYGLNSISVQESFDKIDGDINGREVEHVE